MLTALETGVKGGVWFSLIDKVFSRSNLHSSYAKVSANRGAAGVDHVTVEDFTAGLFRNLEKLETQLREGTYRPQAVRRVHIPKPGTTETRPLGRTSFKSTTSSRTFRERRAIPLATSMPRTAASGYSLKASRSKV